MSLKNIFLILICMTLITLSLYAWSKLSKTWLVIDMANNPELPRHFRTTSDGVRPGVETKGLKEIHAAGSGQFSVASLKQALSKLPSKNVVLIDLRQESHGFLNGHAISWYGMHNADNSQLQSAQIKILEDKLLSGVKQKRTLIAQKILHKNAVEVIDQVEPVQLAGGHVVSEEVVAKQLHLKYLRLYVQDFNHANDIVVDQFVNFIINLPRDTWVYFHCRAGVGRTTLFMVMYDILLNAKDLTLDAILTRQHALGGKDLQKLPDNNEYKYRLSLNRLHFVEDFYLYAKENNDHFKTSWTQWLARHHLKLKI